jgi:hypothetical protein
MTRPRQRPRHPDPELEELIRDAEAQGWRVSKGRKYYKALCPCDDQCMEMIHLTPSKNYVRNKRNKMSKCEGWEQGR